MKKIIILSVITMFINSCSEIDTAYCDKSRNPTKCDQPCNGFDIVLIDSCEYIRTSISNGYSLTHKGNCKNHKR